MEHAYCWGPHLHWFWFMPFLFMILMFVFGCRIFRRAVRWRKGAWRRAGWQAFGCCGPTGGPADNWPADTPGQILDQRYVKGEITKEQYEQMKQDTKSRKSHSRSDD